MRIKYLFNRSIEAGATVILLKLKQKIKPYLFYFHYFFSSNKKIGKKENILSFGQEVKSSLINTYKISKSLRVTFYDHLNQFQNYNEISILGYGVVPLPKGDGWHRDAIHNYLWSQKYFANINYIQLNKHCDVKIPWELSRLQYLVWLCFNNFSKSPIIRNSNIKLDIFKIIYEWEKSNKIGFGVNWVCGMEVAIRAINIAIASTPFLDRTSEDSVNNIHRLLSAHLTYLKRFPEYSDVPGNHFLTDLLGEFVLTLVLYGPHSDVTNLSLSQLINESASQFDNDGFHIERSTVYHRLCVDILAIACAFAHRYELAQVDELNYIFFKAAGFLKEICTETGRIPVIGDQDDGFIIWLGDDARIVDQRLIGSATGTNTSLYDFLMSLSGKGLAFFPVSHTINSVTVSSQIGALRSTSFHTVVKSGPLGLGGRAPHDHDDALSVYLYFNDQPVLIDTGCHSYTLDSSLRIHSIISSSHNGPRSSNIERFTPTSGSIMPSVRGAPTSNIKIINLSTLVAEIVDLSGASLSRQVKIDSTMQFDCVSIVDTCISNRFESELHSDWIFHSQWKVVLDNSCLKESTLQTAFLSSKISGISSLVFKIKSSFPVYVQLSTTMTSPQYGWQLEASRLSIYAKGGSDVTISFSIEAANH